MVHNSCANHNRSGSTVYMKCDFFSSENLYSQQIHPVANNKT